MSWILATFSEPTHTLSNSAPHEDLVSGYSKVETKNIKKSMGLVSWKLAYKQNNFKQVSIFSKILMNIFSDFVPHKDPP